MKQAIPGVSPSDLGEVTAMTVYPSMAASGAGRMIGRLCSMGGSRAYAIGKLFALLLIPLAAGLYFARLLPPLHRRYRLTNRRVIESGFNGTKEIKSVSLDQFDEIDVVVRKGQEWFSAGDLIFKLGDVETFRLDGVVRPQTFRHTCLKARHSYVGVQRYRGLSATGA